MARPEGMPWRLDNVALKQRNKETKMPKLKTKSGVKKRFTAHRDAASSSTASPASATG